MIEDPVIIVSQAAMDLVRSCLKTHSFKDSEEKLNKVIKYTYHYFI